MTVGGRLRKVALMLASSLGLSAGNSQVVVPEAEEVFGTPLSDEADKFLTECNVGFNEKQQALTDTWLRDYDRYDVDLERGLLWISRNGRTTVELDVSVIGSGRPSRKTWEWAWNNPNVEQPLALPRSLFAAMSAKYGLKYLEFGMVPVPNEDFGWYLSGIALRLAGGEGVYKADGDDYEVYLLLRNPRAATPN